MYLFLKKGNILVCLDAFVVSVDGVGEKLPGLGCLGPSNLMLIYALGLCFDVQIMCLHVD